MSALPLRHLGPRCPHCRTPLPAQALHDGETTCSHCSKAFEATVFHPALRTPQVVELAASGPESHASCANHARNAATAGCLRCGLLICALCDMNTGGGPHCPACFERLRTERAVPGAAKRYADYAGIARITAVLGLPMISLGLFIGSAALFFAYLGFKQRRREGRNRTGMVIVMLVALMEILAGGAIILLMVWAVMQAAKK